MKFPYKKIIPIAFWLLVFIPSSYAGDDDTKVTKTIRERFMVPENGFLEITNKYGRIVINSSDNDSVIVKIEVIAYGKDKDAANKIMDRVDFDFKTTNQFLTLETILDRKSGAFKELWNNIGDYSKTLLSKNKLEINYEVYVPKTVGVSLNNKFGDVFISEQKKKATIEVSHGNLRANSFHSRADISVSYGNTDIKHFEKGDLNFKSSEVNIQSIGSADIKSSSSEITIVKANEVVINSRSDKMVEINTGARLRGEMTFSKLKIDHLSKNLDIELSYSDIEVAHIPFNFSLIRIEGKSSDVDLEFESSSYMDLDIKAHEYKLHMPFIDLRKEYIDEKRGLARFRGVVGEKNNYKGSVYIDSQHGPIQIRLKTQPQSVKSK